MNLKNILENIIYIIATAIISTTLTYKATSLAYEKAGGQVLAAFVPMIEKKFEEATTKIENNFKTEIKKLKNKNGVAEITYTPKIESVITQPLDTILSPIPIKKPKKKRFLGIF